MNDAVETEIVKASAPVISAIVEKGMKMFDSGKVRDALAETTQKLAATVEELTEANRLLAETKDELAAKDKELTDSRAMFAGFRDKQELILWGGSFLIIILLAIMISSARQGVYHVTA
jgi:DNA gyrase/topoisomerase IV subunit A